MHRSLGLSAEVTSWRNRRRRGLGPGAVVERRFGVGRYGIRQCDLEAGGDQFLSPRVGFPTVYAEARRVGRILGIGMGFGVGGASILSKETERGRPSARRFRVEFSK